MIFVEKKNIPISQVLKLDLIQAKRQKTAMQLNSVLFHQDNAPAQKALDRQQKIELIGFQKTSTPALAQMDFAVFPRIKAELRGIYINGFSEMRLAILRIV